MTFDWAKNSKKNKYKEKGKEKNKSFDRIARYAFPFSVPFFFFFFGVAHFCFFVWLYCSFILLFSQFIHSARTNTHNIFIHFLHCIHTLVSSFFVLLFFVLSIFLILFSLYWGAMTFLVIIVSWVAVKRLVWDEFNRRLDVSSV